MGDEQHIRTGIAVGIHDLPEVLHKVKLGAG
jgi:hypothetical protein